MAIAVDSAGNVYVTGMTNCRDFPTLNAVQGSFGGAVSNSGGVYGDAFVTEINPLGSAFVFSTFLGGSGGEIGQGITTDNAGNVYVTGWTASSDFPTSHPVQLTYGDGTCVINGSSMGCPDAFVTKLQASGRSVAYSTYLGGGDSDMGFAIAVDSGGSATVLGSTTSLNFPVRNALQGSYGGGASDAFVARMTPTGDRLIYSTYLGGNAEDDGYGVAVDDVGASYITGSTASSSFSTQGAVQMSNGGGFDAFVSKISPTSSGDVPWHPHHVARFSDGLSANVDLSDGHVDVAASDMSIPGKGPDLTVGHTWDSTLAQAPLTITTAAGQGWQSDLTLNIGGVLTGTVVYTDATGAIWPFVYTGTVTAPGPYTAYASPPGLPWQLTTASNGYTLTNILTGDVRVFGASGYYGGTVDSYGNSNSLIYGSSGITETNRGVGAPAGRSLNLYYNAGGRYGQMQSPLWHSGAVDGQGQRLGQDVTYGYNAGGQLTGLTRGAGTADALAAGFGYSGTQMVTVTTPAGHAWQLGYDSMGRLSSMTSPVSGTVGQAGYTSSYTTTFTYTPGQTVVVEGASSSAPLTTTYTLDGQGQATAVADGLGHTTSSTYDADHDVLASTDANGNTTTYGYQYVGPGASSGLGGPVGLVTQTVRPPVAYDCIPPGCAALGAGDAVTTTETYTVNNDLATTTNGNGWVTAYGYDSHHGVVTTTEQLTVQGTGCRRPPCPTSVVRPQTVVNPRDGIARRGSLTGYDASGEVTATIDGRGIDATADGVITVRFDAAQATWRSTYDPLTGDLLSTGTPPVTSTRQVAPAVPSTWQLLANQPLTTTYGYDADGNQTSMSDPSGTTTGYSYDHLGRRVQTTLPSVPLYDGTTAAPVQTTAYDAEGNVVQEVDGNGGVTQSSYDPLGRLVSSTSAVSGTQLITYTATGKAAEQDEVGNLTRYAYDGAGRLTMVTDPLTGTTLYGYDAVGNTTAITAPGGLAIEEQAYDAQNRLIRDTAEGPLGAAGPVTSTLDAYDSEGNVVQTQAANGDVTYRQVDGVNRVTEVDLLPGANQLTLSPWRVQTWSYDDVDNLAQSTDGDQRAQSSVYDGANRAVLGYDVGTGSGPITTTQAYDPQGQAITTTTQSGAQPPVVDLAAYNAAGWRTRTQNQYDPAKPRALYTYGYDKAGQQRTQQINGSSAYAVTTTLDAEGLARAMTETLVPTSPATATWSYYPTDQLRSSAVGTALTTTQFYDGNSRLAHWEARSTSGATTPLSRSVDYGHLPTGWTSAVTSTSGAGAPSVQAYSHDPQGRLTSTQGPGSATASWSYDKDGNILQAVSSGGVTTTYGYTGTSGVAVPTAWKPGELLWTQAGSAPPTVYGYDGSGHTTAISTTSGYSLTLGYDPQGRLGGVHALQGPVQVTQTQSYNASGLRSGYAVTRTGTAPLTLSEAFIYRAGQVGSLVSISNSVVTTDTFVYDQRGLPLALIHSPAGGTPARYWYVLDGHATVVALTDSAGNVVDSYSYDAWGKPLSVNEQVTQPYRYASYWYDTELGWYWVQVRHYSPSLQRWLQPDPSRQDGTLSYVYVGDDPVDAIDPAGTFIIFLPAIWYAGGVAFSVVGGVLVVCQLLSETLMASGRGFRQRVKKGLTNH